MTMLPLDPRWDAPMPCKDPQARRVSLREGLKASGNRSFDVDAFARSEYGQRYLDGLEPIFLSDDPMDARVLDYWYARGLRKKRVHGGPQSWNDWIIFTPLSAERPENASRRYPVVIALHGGAAGEFDGEPVFFAESSGYARKAAEEEFILALPEDHDAEPILRLYDYIMAHEPADASRVYLAGFSAGGDRSCRVALKRPELFAGMCIGAGVPFSLSRDEKEIANATKHKLPFIAVGCLNDKGNHTPLCQSNPLDNPVPDFIARILTAEGKMGWINTFFDINHVAHGTLSDNLAYLEHGGTVEEKRLGMPAHRSFTWEWAGAKHLCLDYTDREGLQSVRYVFIEGLPHTEPVDMMDIAWPYLKRFSRRISDGQLICDQAEVADVPSFG